MALDWSNVSLGGAAPSQINTGTNPNNYASGVGPGASAASYVGGGGSAGGAGSGVAGRSVTTQTQNATNMDPTSLAALQVLIQQLLGGGTQEQRTGAAQRTAEIDAVRNQRAGFTKEAALGDAQGAIAQQLRQTMESLVPNLTRAAEGSGTSQNSMRALLLQDAAARAAESSSKVGLDAVANYGQIGSALSGVLEALTRPNNGVSDALLNALQIAKGTVTQAQSVTDAPTQMTSGGGGGGGGGRQTQSMYDSYKPINTGGTYGSGITGQMANDGMAYYGPLTTTSPLDVNSLAWSQLMSGTGSQSGGDLYDALSNGGWNNYTF